MSSFEGFAGSSKAYICSGTYPKALTEAWNQFDSENGRKWFYTGFITGSRAYDHYAGNLDYETIKSQNEKPWEKLPRKQIYITLKMNDCGQDLEKLAPFNATDAVSLLKTLAKNLEKVRYFINYES